MSYLAMPTRFSPQTIAAARALATATPELPVGELYGSASGLGWGSGRHPDSLPTRALDEVCQHIASARAQGLRFNYIVNPVCFGNREYSSEGIASLLGLVTNLVEAGADILTVANPYLVSVLSRRFPQLTVNVSVIAGIRTMGAAQFFLEAGARRLTLHTDLNRDLELLGALRSALPCELEILLNRGCLLDCPAEHYHYCVLGHFEAGPELDSWINYCTLRCALTKLRRPVEVFRSGWLRPQDVPRYIELGIDAFKIVGRELDLGAITRVTHAYARQAPVADLGEVLCGFVPTQTPSGRAVTAPVHIDGLGHDALFEQRFRPLGECLSGCTNGCQACVRLAAEALRMEDAEALIEALESAWVEHLASLPDGVADVAR